MLCWRFQESCCHWTRSGTPRCLRPAASQWQPLSRTTACRAEPLAAPLRVALLLSGGVDSSLALKLLQEAGHQVTAFYLQIWFQDDFRNFWSACPWEADLAVCKEVSIDCPDACMLSQRLNMMCQGPVLADQKSTTPCWSNAVQAGQTAPTTGQSMATSFSSGL